MAGRLIGRDVLPVVGLRVEMDPRRGKRGVGSIVQLNEDGKSVAVNWDSGERDNALPTGEDGQFYLVKADRSTNAQPPAQASPRYVEPPQPAQASPRYVEPQRYPIPERPRTFEEAQQPLRSSFESQPSYQQPRVSSPRVVNQPYPTSQPSYQKPPTYPSASYQPQPQRRPLRSNGSGSDLLEQASGLKGLSSTPQSRYSQPTKSLAANVSRANTTVGMSVYGTKVDLVVPGGPAQLTQNLAKHDEILEVDGRPVTQDTLTAAIIGNDAVNSTVQLLVRKASTGQIVNVEVMRVPKKSIEGMVELFELLTKLKQNGHNNVEYERRNYPAEEEYTVDLVDRVVALFSAIQLEKYATDMRTRRQFQDLYDELRQHLSEAYAEMEQMERQQTQAKATPGTQGPEAEAATAVKQQQQQEAPSATRSAAPPPPPQQQQQDDGAAEALKLQVETLTAELEEMKKELGKANAELGKANAELGHAHDVEDELAVAKRKLAEPKPLHTVEDLEALRGKDAELAKEHEKGLQRNFEIRRLQAQSDLLVEELEAAQRALIAKEEELQQRSAEDADLERKVQMLQGHLDAVENEGAEVEEVQRQARERERQMQDAHRLELQELARSSNADSQVLNEQLEQARQQVQKKTDELEALRERLKLTGKEVEALESALKDASSQLQEDKVEMRRLQERARQGAFRAGDVADVLVRRATGLPHTLTHESDVREVFVMINIDGRHQVQQTSKQMGRDLEFEERFTCQLEPASRTLHASVYANEPSKPAELVGQARLDLEKVKWGPGETVVLSLVDDEGRTLHEQPPSGGRSGRAASLELVVGKANVGPEKAARAEQDREELRALMEELEAARECIRVLETQAEETRQQVRAARGEAESAAGLRKEVRRLEGEIEELKKRLAGREVQVQELESTVAIKDQLVQDIQRSVVSVQKEKQLKVSSLEDTIQNLRNSLSTEQGAKQEVREVKEERDLLLQRVKVLTQDLVAAQDGVDSLQKLLKAKEGDGTLATHLEREIGTLKDKLVAQEDAARKAEAKSKQLEKALADAKTSGPNGPASTKEYEAEMLKMQVQLDQVQVQYDDLLKQFQQTRRKDAAEADQEIGRLQTRVQGLLQQLDASQARNRSASPPPQDAPRRVIPREALPVQRSSAPPPMASDQVGVIGIKIENNPPHHVMSVTELMDEYGKVINDRVKVGHELIEIEGQHVKNLPVGDVIRRVSGPPGTVVNLRFLDETNNRVYEIKALRHVPLNRLPTGSGSAGPTRSPLTTPRLMGTGIGSAGLQLTSTQARSPPLIRAASPATGSPFRAASPATGSGSAGPPPPAASFPNLKGPGVPVTRLASPSTQSPPPFGTTRGNPVSNRTSPASPRAELV